MRGLWLVGFALLGIALAGCAAHPAAVISETTSSSATQSTAPVVRPVVLFLNVTLGNSTIAFSSSDEASGNATHVVGSAPVNASFELGASGLPSGNASWTLSFGTGDASAGNASAGDPANGTALPSTVEHAFSGNGTFNVTFAVNPAAAPAQRLDATVIIRSGNATVEVRPVEVLFQTQFSGSLPVDGLTAGHPFDVPEGATRVEVLYTSDHVGLFTALASVSDPSGERINSSDACGFGSTGAETDTCLMIVEEDVGAGAWSADLTWQVGQATEDYTFDVTVYGYA
jgi:hypothetical protein